MPTLARANDGHYFVRHYYRGHKTWQITAHGVLHLKRRGIEERDRFLTEQFMDLWVNAWVYTGSKPERRVWPPVVGDRNVPTVLRDAIANFDAALRNGEATTAWQFVLKPEGADAASEAILFDRFRRSITGRPLRSWMRADIRTSSPDFHWIATMALKIGQTNESTVPLDLDEHWVRTEFGFCVLDERHRASRD